MTQLPLHTCASQEAGKFKDEIVPVETDQIIEKDGELLKGRLTCFYLPCCCTSRHGARCLLDNSSCRL